jgi:hypothetical protein
MSAGTVSILSASTLASYLSADYRVQAGEQTLSLHIGESSAALRHLFDECAVAQAVLVTACNPFGELCTPSHNADLLAGLRRHLEQQGHAFLPSAGVGTEEGWPDEPGFLVLEVALPAALQLCELFRQNAVVTIAGDGIPRLLFHPRLELPDDEASAAILADARRVLRP